MSSTHHWWNTPQLTTFCVHIAIYMTTTNSKSMLDCTKDSRTCTSTKLLFFLSFSLGRDHSMGNQCLFLRELLPVDCIDVTSSCSAQSYHLFYHLFGICGALSFVHLCHYCFIFCPIILARLFL